MSPRKKLLAEKKFLDDLWCRINSERIDNESDFSDVDDYVQDLIEIEDAVMKILLRRESEAQNEKSISSSAIPTHAKKRVSGNERKLQAIKSQ